MKLLIHFSCKQGTDAANYFGVPCKPPLGPSPELMQPQPSLRVVQGSTLWRQHMWRQHMGGACWGAKMGGFGVERPF